LYLCTAKNVEDSTTFAVELKERIGKMVIQRGQYISELLSKRWNGKVKIITGIRRCGKSFLLFTLYKNYLQKEGVSDDCFIELALDKKAHIKYRNPNELYNFVLQKSQDADKHYYVFIDEIQLSYKVKNDDIDESMVPEEDRDMLYTTFYDILNDLMGHENLDIYVTGSNSKMLSKDVVTNFRDRGTEIKVFPLSFKEFYPVTGQEKADAFEEYLTYGGMPLAVLEDNEIEKRKYLKSLHTRVYIKDIVERYKLKDDEVLNALVEALSSAVGSLTNPHNLANAAGSLMKRSTSDHTIKNYLEYLEEAYLFISAQRYDIKGKRYFENTLKYYSMDVGLRNAKLNFRQQEKSHLMENVIFVELIRRGYNVDVGVVELTTVNDGKKQQSQYEIDFVVNTGHEKVYIQSALNVDTETKKQQETFSLKNSGDFFRKIVITDGNAKAWTDEDGVMYVGVIPFLLEDNLIIG
jgi:predicted AAA+ superfamily ATPase